jgi:plasmid stabilization system protein ParE
MNVRVLPEAIERIDEARAWWLEHREKAPNLFDEELERALDAIATAPATGQRVPLRRGRSVRRMLMPKTAFHVYYEITDEEVRVLTIWGAVRSRGPSLR